YASPTGPSPAYLALHPSPTRRSSDLERDAEEPGKLQHGSRQAQRIPVRQHLDERHVILQRRAWQDVERSFRDMDVIPDVLKRARSEEHTSELQSRENLVCRLLLEKKN